MEVSQTLTLLPLPGLLSLSPPGSLKHYRLLPVLIPLDSPNLKSSLGLLKLLLDSLDSL